MVINISLAIDDCYSNSKEGGDEAHRTSMALPHTVLVVVLYHSNQFGSHASQGPQNRRNITGVTPILTKCRNYFKK